MRTLLLFFITALLVISCRKKNNQKEPELPPETQTGAYTFGCKVDGKVFLPRDGNGKPGLFAQYVNLGSGTDGGWYLGLNANDWQDKNIPTVRVKTDSLLLVEGISYVLKSQKGYPSCEYNNGYNFFRLSLQDSGRLTITKHSQTQRILSGRFWFTATNANGEKVNVTDGRFDIVY